VSVTAFLAAAVLLFLFRWREEGFDWRLFAATFRKLDLFWLLAAGAFGLATYVGRVLRWAILMRPVCLRPNLKGLFSATAIGFTAVVVFGRPGEFVRPYLVSLKERLPFSSQAAAWLLERMFDLLAALMIFGFALAQIGRSGIHAGPTLAWVLKAGGWIVAIVGFMCLAVLFLLSRYAQPMQQRLLGALSFLPATWHSRVQELVVAFVRGAESIRDLGSLLWILLYTAIEWALIAACYVTLFRAFPDLKSFRLPDVLIFIGFVSFGSIVQLPGIGGGMQLVAIVVLTELFGAPLELAAGVALMLWIITFVVIVPVGVIMLFHEGLNWQKLKEMEARASI
jgi:glycosyltransferase 2 family protein